jgi:dTDP-4-dehydrorhamnose reductase
MYQSLKEGKPVRLFFDQFRTPLSLKEAAAALSMLIEKDIMEEIINFGGRERLSRYDMGEILCRKAALNSELLIRTSMYDITSLPKCADVSMNTNKLQSLGINAKGTEESIDLII